MRPGCFMKPSSFVTKLKWLVLSNSDDGTNSTHHVGMKPPPVTSHSKLQQKRAAYWCGGNHPVSTALH